MTGRYQIYCPRQGIELLPSCWSFESAVRYLSSNIQITIPQAFIILLESRALRQMKGAVQRVVQDEAQLSEVHLMI